MVYLIGTGPGDEELLTVKAVKALKKCTAVLYDRLGSNNILNYLNDDCEIYYCGKKPGSHYKTQDEINKKLVELAKKGHTVGRIKGGDPFVFGRGGEEILALLDANINDFEVIPGVTSPISVLNYAGIPITHRKIAQSFHVITGMAQDKLNVNFKALAKEEGTLVFMMGLTNLEMISSKLIENGKDKNTKVAVIMEGTTSNQRKVVGNLENIVYKVKEAKIKSPCIIVVGDVVQFNDKFNWYEKKSLFGKNICITRTKEQSYNLKNRLSELGATVTEINSIKIKDTCNNLDNVNLLDYKYIILTSKNAVSYLFKYILNKKIDIRDIKAKFCCIGKATSKSLSEKGIIPHLTSKEFCAESLLEDLKDTIKKEDKVLLPTSKKARNTIQDSLSRHNIIVDRVNIYDTVCGVCKDKNVFNNVDAVFYTSPSTVTNMINIFGIDKIKEKKAISIGPLTSKELEKNNISCETCTEHSEEGFLKQVEQLLK